MLKFHRMSLKQCWMHSYSHCSLHLCWHSSTFEQEPVFPSHKSCSPFSATTGTWQSAVPYHWRSNVLADFFLKGSHRSYLMVQVRTIGWLQQHGPPKICVCLCGAHTCVYPSTATDGQHFRHFCCGTNLMMVSIQISFCFSISVRAHCHPPWQEVYRINTIVNPKVCDCDFDSWQHTHKFLLTWGYHMVLFVRFMHGFRFKMVDPCFLSHDSLWQEVLTCSVVLAQKISGSCFPRFFRCIWHC